MHKVALHLSLPFFSLYILVVHFYLFIFFYVCLYGIFFCFIQQNTKERIRCDDGMCAVRFVHNIIQTISEFVLLYIKFRLFFIVRSTDYRPFLVVIVAACHRFFFFRKEMHHVRTERVASCSHITKRKKKCSRINHRFR